MNVPPSVASTRTSTLFLNAIERHETCWLKACFDDCCYLPFGRDRSLAGKAHMEYIEKIYSFCCHLNENPRGYDTDVIPLVCCNRQIDMGRTIYTAKCKYYSIKEHRAFISSFGDLRE